jgi:peptidoglycan/xylan/chitin deacetylase (PgdA/CDA1 family)
MTLPPLPLLLWEIPPGLEQILAQEGVPTRRVEAAQTWAFHDGRFVLFDSRRLSRETVAAVLRPDHVALDIDALRPSDSADPFEALLETKGTWGTWHVGAWTLTERIGRQPRATIRRYLIDRIRSAVVKAGGLWARLAPFPFPYRSAFNLRVDLDEPRPDDYFRFAKARRPLGGCCTHFVSTHAYRDHAAVLSDLREHDTQSHGHYHVVYRDARTNLRNVRRAHRILKESGFRAVGFAAPHGRWNAGLDTVLERLGYQYSSEFQVGYDDLPFYPWRTGRFSRVLQIPIHPICEGLFVEAGATDGQPVAQHLVKVVAAKLAAGEPAFVYGHPERRLGRFPEIVAALADAVAGQSLVWRVTLTEFDRWWRWRHERRWGVAARSDGRLEVQFEEWQPQFPLGLEIVRGRHVATVPVTAPRMSVRLQDLAYEQRSGPAAIPAPVLQSKYPGWKAVVREAIGWETITPLEELPADTLSARVKKELRRWRSRREDPVRT